MISVSTIFPYKKVHFKNFFFHLTICARKSSRLGVRGYMRTLPSCDCSRETPWGVFLCFRVVDHCCFAALRPITLTEGSTLRGKTPWGTWTVAEPYARSRLVEHWSVACPRVSRLLAVPVGPSRDHCRLQLGTLIGYPLSSHQRRLLGGVTKLVRNLVGILPPYCPGWPLTGQYPVAGGDFA